MPKSSSSAAAHRVAVDAVGDLDRDHVVHLVRDVAEDAQPEAADPGEHRPAVQLVPGDGLRRALLDEQPRALVGARTACVVASVWWLSRRGPQ